jgi:hypothetical protein
MSFLIESRLFAVLCQNVTHCGPDGQRNPTYNTIQIIPPGIPCDEALVIIKNWQNAKKNPPEESDS